MEETRTDKDIEDIKEALKLVEVIVLTPGPEVWAEALQNPERAISLGIPESVHNFYQKQTAPLLNLVLQKIFLYGLGTLANEVGSEELDRRQKQLEEFFKGNRNVG